MISWEIQTKWNGGKWYRLNTINCLKAENWKTLKNNLKKKKKKKNEKGSPKRGSSEYTFDGSPSKQLLEKKNI